MRLDDMPVGRKLLSVMVATLTLVAVASGVSQWRANHAMHEALAQVESHDAQIVRAVRWQGLTHAATQGSAAAALSTEAKVVELFVKREGEIVATINALQKEILAHVTSPQEKAAMERMGEGRKSVRAVLERIGQARKAGDQAAMEALTFNELLPNVERYLALLGEFVKFQETQRDEAKAAAVAQGERSAWLGWLTMAAVLGLGLAGMVALVRSVVRPLEQAVDAAQRIAAGDLAADGPRSTRGDEVGRLQRAMAEMAERLRDVVGQVRQGVHSVQGASGEIAQGNQDLSGRTEQMAANLQQSASALEQLTATVSQSADTARQANQLASAAAAAAREGGESVAQVVANMERISEGSRRIADIIGVIDGIAFQTNILALNAAVEAARAGEQGRGFAVVAGEVRSLAQRSAEAAKEIKALIGSSTATVEAGSAQVARTGEAMQEIVSGVQRVSDLIGEIAAAAGEQRDGITQVNQAVGSLDQVTQQNAALVEESAAAAQSLRQQAERLADAVAVFRLDREAGATAPAAPNAPRLQAQATLQRAGQSARVAVRASAAAPGRVLPKATAPKPAVPAASGDDGDWSHF